MESINQAPCRCDGLFCATFAITVARLARFRARWASIINNILDAWNERGNMFVEVWSHSKQCWGLYLEYENTNIELWYVDSELVSRRFFRQLNVASVLLVDLRKLSLHVPDNKREDDDTICTKDIPSLTSWRTACWTGICRDRTKRKLRQWTSLWIPGNEHLHGIARNDVTFNGSPARGSSSFAVNHQGFFYGLTLISRIPVLPRQSTICHEWCPDVIALAQGLSTHKARTRTGMISDWTTARDKKY